MWVDGVSRIFLFFPGKREIFVTLNLAQLKNRSPPPQNSTLISVNDQRFYGIVERPGMKLVRAVINMSQKAENSSIVLGKIVEKRIFLIRGKRVVLSGDLADLYRVSPKVFMQSVRRNLERFPEDFMFQLNFEEAIAVSRSQTVTLKQGGNIKYAPYAFTEQGIAMLSSVLRSPTAIKVNIEIMRAFVRLREIISQNATLLKKVEILERKFEGHDRQIQEVFQVIREVLNPAVPAKRPIGIRTKD